ncbi:MAG: hypothetical protein K9H64_20415 [Bacteroidales bacterium]|nr:hypothetical protein [Bacteroidales bacterium]MCF8458429.1 hypothetical protein [Bacteroidales bacterium]
MKKLLITFLFTSLFVGLMYSQNSTFALHVYNPLGLFQKAGIKLEYRANRTGLLLGAIQYYGSLPEYPGTQIGFEWRRYAVPQPEKRGENFFYARLLAGQQEHVTAHGDGFFAVKEVPGANYYGVGAGVGKHINFGHFFFDLNAGLKAVLSNVKQDKAFYITSAASVLDLHFNLGFQF